MKIDDEMARLMRAMAGTGRRLRVFHVLVPGGTQRVVAYSIDDAVQRAKRMGGRVCQ